MSGHTQRKAPTEDERQLAWDRWLDGDSPAAIHRFDLCEHSLAEVRRILDGEPPEKIRSDPRFLLGARFFWISASGLANPDTGKQEPFVVVQSPRTYVGKAFQSAIRAIRRDVRACQAGADLELQVIEGVEPEVALRFVNDRGYRGYRFDEAGSIERVLRIEVPEPEASSPAP